MRLHSRSTAILASLVSLAPALYGQLRLHDRFVVDPAEVSRALAIVLNRDYPFTSAPQVWLLSDVTTSEANPQLEVDRNSVRHALDTRHQATRGVVRIRCRSVRVCLPFYISVAWSTASTPTSTATISNDTTQAKPLITSGAHLTLVLETGSARLQLPVIALQPGLQGDSIRVASLDRRRVYTAKVVSTQLLQGSL